MNVLIPPTKLVSSTRFRRDERTWRDRLTDLHHNWRPLISGMVDAYLRWKYPDNVHAGSGGEHGPTSHSQPPLTSTSVTTTTPTTDNSPTPPQAPAANDPASSTSPDTEVPVIDIYTLSDSIKVSRTESQTTASALASLGFIGNAPFHPSVAISIKTLELYRILRRRKPSFSVEAFAKVICDLYMVRTILLFVRPVLIVQKIPYRPKYRRFFSNAFDTYLEVLGVVDKRVKEALGHGSPNWRVLNACPACSYEVCRVFHTHLNAVEFPQLEGEPELVFQRMFAIDGNDSLKRIARIGSRDVGDRRCFSSSDYYIPTEEVDKWAKEAGPISQEEAGSSDGEDSDDDAAKQDDEATSPGPCADNWKAAQSDSKKRMWGVFEETGLFASACRHGFILWVADMVRSGEQ